VASNQGTAGLRADFMNDDVIIFRMQKRNKVKKEKKEGKRNVEERGESAKQISRAVFIRY
jgi:hypothetical protein